MPGRAVVEAAPVPEITSGGIHLPFDAGWEMMADVGILLGYSDKPARGRYGRIVAKPLVGCEVGDLVLLRRISGTSYKTFRFPNYQPQGEIRMYGCRGGHTINDNTRGAGFVPENISPNRCIMAKYDFEKEAWIPSENNVLVEFKKQDEQTSGGILLAESARKKTPVASVVAIGPKVTEVKVGDNVLIHEGAVEGNGLEIVEERFIDAILT